MLGRERSPHASAFFGTTRTGPDSSADWESGDSSDAAGVSSGAVGDDGGSEDAAMGSLS